jgi:hypothetical protein
MAKGTIAAAAAALTAREAITARGVSLLALIAASTEPSEGVLMLTQEEAGEAFAAGYVTVDNTIVEGNTAAVSLTDAGKAALTSTEATPAGAAAANGFEIDAAIPLPGAGSRRGRSGGYPFEALEVGQSFHVKPSKEDDTLDALLTRISSSVSGARTRFAEETGETETVKVKTYKRKEDGKGFEKDAAGKRIVENEVEETRPKMRVTRDFVAAKVGADDPKGEGVRIWRKV